MEFAPLHSLCVSLNRRWKRRLCDGERERAGLEYCTTMMEEVGYTSFSRSETGILFPAPNAIEIESPAPSIPSHFEARDQGIQQAQGGKVTFAWRKQLLSEATRLFIVAAWKIVLPGTFLMQALPVWRGRSYVGILSYRTIKRASYGFLLNLKSPRQ